VRRRRGASSLTSNPGRVVGRNGQPIPRTKRPEDVARLIEQHGVVVLDLSHELAGAIAQARALDPTGKSPAASDYQQQSARLAQARQQRPMLRQRVQRQQRRAGRGRGRQRRARRGQHRGGAAGGFANRSAHRSWLASLSAPRRGGGGLLSSRKILPRAQRLPPDRSARGKSFPSILHRSATKKRRGWRRWRSFRAPASPGGRRQPPHGARATFQIVLIPLVARRGAFRGAAPAAGGHMLQNRPTPCPLLGAGLRSFAANGGWRRSGGGGRPRGRQPLGAAAQRIRSRSRAMSCHGGSGARTS
jgi:hypothetical protein